MRRSEARETLRAVEELIERLNQEADLVIVEGRHDEATLRSLGLEVDVMKIACFKGSLALFVDEISERFRGRRVSLLLDFDEAGERLTKRLLQELSGRELQVDIATRERLRELLCYFGFSTIESIVALKRRAYPRRGR